MSDSSLLTDVFKVLGGSVFGGLLTAWNARRKMKNMRKNLYKEIAFNYGILHHEFETTPYSALARGQSLHFALNYYNFTKQDLNTFHELSESNTIVVFYDHLEGALRAQPLDVPGPVGYAMLAVSLIHDAVDDGYLNKTLLLEQSSPYVQQALKKGVAATHAQREEMSAELKRTQLEKAHPPQSASQ